MPPPPLIARAGRRSALLTTLMAGLLVCALFTAAWVTGAPLTRPRPATVPPIDLRGAVLAPPSGWVLAQILVDDHGADSGWELVDTAEPGRRLRIYRAMVPAQTTSQEVLTALLPRLIPRRRPITRFKTPEADGAAAQDSVFEIFFSTRRLSPVGDDGSPQVHAIAAIRPAPDLCWVVQLTTLVPGNRWSEQAEIEQLQALRKILERLSVAPST